MQYLLHTCDLFLMWWLYNNVPYSFWKTLTSQSLMCSCLVRSSPRSGARSTGVGFPITFNTDISTSVSQLTLKVTPNLTHGWFLPFQLDHLFYCPSIFMSKWFITPWRRESGRFADTLSCLLSYAEIFFYSTGPCMYAALLLLLPSGLRLLAGRFLG